MNKDVVIETQRLILRQWKVEDIPDMVEGLNNIHVTKWLASAPFPYTEEDARAFVERTIDNDLLNFAIVLKSENKVIGGTQISNMDTINGTAGGGLWIHEKYQGLGYGTEAFEARIKYAFNVLGLRRLENGYFKGNERSHKMQLRLGYKDEGVKRKNFLSKATGELRDECITGLLREEFVEVAERKKNVNIFVLHSLNGDTLKMWGPDIKETFEKQGIDVFMPEFPIREESSYEKFDTLLQPYLESKQLGSNTIVIAHSIGNAYFIRFCKEHQYQPKAYIAVAPGAVYEYPSSRKDYIVEVSKQAYLRAEHLNYMRSASCMKYCLYSDEDDHNVEKFTRFLKDIDAEGVYLKGYNHFDGYHRIYKIPELNELIRKLLAEADDKAY